MGSILKPEVELMVLLRMPVIKLRKKVENALKMQFGDLSPRTYMFFRHDKSEFEVLF